MILVTINKKEIDVPTSWNELTVEQLLQIMDSFYVKDYNASQLCLKLLKSILGLTYKQFFKLKTDVFEDYLYLVGFLLDEKIGLTKQLIPSYENLYGPTDEIGNMVGGEFIFSEEYHERWWNDKTNETALNDFVSIIYRPAKKDYDFEKNIDGDCRAEFNENVSAYYSRTFIANWPMPVKLAIATWYAGCRQKLVEDNEEVFNGKGEPAKYGLISTMRMIAEKGTYGTFDAVLKMHISLLMIELNETVEEGKRLEEQLKSNKSG